MIVPSNTAPPLCMQEIANLSPSEGAVPSLNFQRDPYQHYLALHGFAHRSITALKTSWLEEYLQVCGVTLVCVFLVCVFMVCNPGV